MSADERSKGLPIPPGDTWRRRSGDLQVILMLTRDPDDFAKEWNSTPIEHNPVIETLTETKREEWFGAVVLFAGCAKDNNPCAVTIDFMVVGPDGIEFEESNGHKMRLEAVPSATDLYLFEHAFDLEVGSGSPLGTYTVVAFFKVDGKGGPSVSVSQQIEVVG